MVVADPHISHSIDSISTQQSPKTMGLPSIKFSSPGLTWRDELDSDPPQMDASEHLPSQLRGNLKSVSVVVPVLNEADNLNELARQISDALQPTGRSFEIILVDDGSTDNSHQVLQRLIDCSNNTPPIQAIVLAGNFGQTAALKAGIEAAVGDYIVTLDGDLQNDPADIPGMLDKLDAGFEIVLGWRKHRQDHLWSRKIPSQIANLLVRRVTHTRVRDLGCALKAMTRELAVAVGFVWRYAPFHRSAG